MTPFTYISTPVRVIFGSGTRLKLADEIRLLGASRALFLSTPQQAEAAKALAREVGALAAGVFTGAAMHTPVDVTEAAVGYVEEIKADCVVAMGGGSTIGLGKAIAFRTDLPQIVVPTTYAGSEVTSILGQTERAAKTTIRSPRVLPEVIIYDVDLTMTLPGSLTSVSGMNAIAHAVEALYAVDRNPIISILAEEGIRSLAHALPALHRNPGDGDARASALCGAWLCGTCLNAVQMGLHHKLCHTLGGSFGLPHAETHTVILPHAVQYNAAAAPVAMQAIARALKVQDAAQGLFDLVQQLDAPRSLETLGMKHDDLDRAAEIAVRVPYVNPEPISGPAIRDLLESAFHGRRPKASH